VVVVAAAGALVVTAALAIATERQSLVWLLVLGGSFVAWRALRSGGARPALAVCLVAIVLAAVPVDVEFASTGRPGVRLVRRVWGLLAPADAERAVAQGIELAGDVVPFNPAEYVLRVSWLPTGGEGRGSGNPHITRAEAGERWLEEFTAHPRARLVCRQHVVGAGPTGPHIEWTLYSTPDAPTDVVAFYAATRGLEVRSGQTRLTVDAAEGRTLSVHPVGDSYPDCGTKPGAEDRTVVVVSQLIAVP